MMISLRSWMIRKLAGNDLSVGINLKSAGIVGTAKHGVFIHCVIDRDLKTDAGISIGK